MLRLGWKSAVLVIVALVVLLAAGCGNSSGSFTSNPPTGTVRVSVSDPPTCEAPKGIYENIYVTIVDVLAHTSTTAGEGTPGWISLAPTLKDNPKQVDLLGQADNACFLASLGSNTQVPAGQYQQLRVILARDNQAPANSACGASIANCVVLAADPNNPQKLHLSSEANTGIKIPSGQIAGGKFEVPDGSVMDLNVDFNACASIVMDGGGRFRLKPVLHAGEASLTAASVSGTVVDSVTKAALDGGTVVVALEQKDSNGVDRVIMETVADASGNFAFCPVPEGTFDVVAVGIDQNNIAYSATVVTGVQSGNSIPALELFAQAAPDTSQGTITGLVTSKNGSGVEVDVSLSALQAIAGDTQITVPLTQLPGATASFATSDQPGTCPANTFCEDYSLSLSAANPYVGAFGATITYAQDDTSAGAYVIEGRAFKPGSGGESNCTTPVTVNQDTGANPLDVTSGGSLTAADLNFTGCTAP